MIKIGAKRFDWGARTYIMGIVNTTPDSFSGDGTMSRAKDWTDVATLQGIQMVSDGADILDVGGESTRPGAVPISAYEELKRVIPVIEKLAKKVSIPISVDTYKSEVAREAIRAGASIVNDVWGLTKDPELAKVAAENKTPLIIVHNRSSVDSAEMRKGLGGRFIGISYRNLLSDIKSELGNSIEVALRAGVSRENIIVDPGIGFGKTVEQNLELINKLNELKDLRFPILVGPSRKSFIGYTVNVPPEERLEGTAAAVAICIERGADVVRVHDVKAMSRVARMTDAIVRRANR